MAMVSGIGPDYNTRPLYGLGQSGSLGKNEQEPNKLAFLQLTGSQSVRPSREAATQMINGGVDKTDLLGAAAASFATQGVNTSGMEQVLKPENQELLAMVNGESYGGFSESLNSWAKNAGAPVNDGSGFNGGTLGQNLDVNVENLADYYCKC